MVEQQRVNDIVHGIIILYKLYMGICYSYSYTYRALGHITTGKKNHCIESKFYLCIV